jgi:CheY-like chemotaxis protein
VSLAQGLKVKLVKPADERLSVSSSKRVLLVDDYPDVLDMWGLYLRLRGYDVDTASDGFEAIERAHEHVPDVVVLDLGLPGINGCEVAVRLREAPDTSSVPLIAATGYSNTSQLIEARESGFDAIVLKPVDPAQLEEEIERQLESKPH